MGRNDEAKKLFDEQIAAYPAGNETNAALYWRARLAEEDNDSAMARAFYQKLSDRYRNYYYAELGRQRMKKLPAGPDAAGQYSLLDRIPPLDHEPDEGFADAPDSSLGAPPCLRLRREDIQAIFQDIEVERTQIDDAEVIQSVVDLVEGELFESSSNIGRKGARLPQHDCSR